MNDATNGILNTTLTRDYVCAGCHGLLVERWGGADGFIVVCPKGCGAPHVSRRAADRVKARWLKTRAPKLDRPWRTYPAGTDAALALFEPITKEETNADKINAATTHLLPTPHTQGNLMTDKEITQTATNELLSLPAELREAEILVANLQVDLRQAKSDMAAAEMEAQVNAQVDGKNAEARKLQMEQAVRLSPAVTAARERLALLEAQLATAEVDQAALARRFRAALVLAELQSARIMYLTTFKIKNYA